MHAKVPGRLVGRFAQRQFTYLGLREAVPSVGYTYTTRIPPLQRSVDFLDTLIPHMQVSGSDLARQEWLLPRPPWTGQSAELSLERRRLNFKGSPCPYTCVPLTRRPFKKDVISYCLHLRTSRLHHTISLEYHHL